MKLRIASPLVTVSLLATAAFAQNPATQGSASGRYGLSAWAINNQRVASLFNYDVDSAFGSGLANFCGADGVQPAMTSAGASGTLCLWRPSSLIFKARGS